MGIKSSFTFYFVIVCLLGTVVHSYSQEVSKDIEALKASAPKVFIDCDHCDIDYIRTEITFVNYVVERKEADVHVLITTQRTGSGGTEYTLAFLGKREFEALQNTLTFCSKSTDTDDEIRKGLAQVLRLGLAPYVANTPMAEALSVRLDRRVRPTAVKDRWNFWVFDIGLHSHLSGEKSRKSTSLYIEFSVDRVTPASKLNLELSGDYEKDHYEYEDETWTSTSEDLELDGLYVLSINDHWSVGGWTSLESSTYRNLDLAFKLQPAIEYNIFPYSESTRRQLRLLYKAGYVFNRYREETMYDKMSERLLSEALCLTLELNEPWGTAEISLEGSHYFYDFNKNRLSLDGDLSVRIFKGLSFDLYGNYSATHDQLYLAKGEATVEEILLQRRELASDYQYFLSVGLSYRFGSIFSNVVNPRFGQPGDEE